MQTVDDTMISFVKGTEFLNQVSDSQLLKVSWRYLLFHFAKKYDYDVKHWCFLTGSLGGGE